MIPLLRSTLAIAAMMQSIAPSQTRAQGDSIEHWLLMTRVSGRTDSLVRHVRVRWNGDSISGPISPQQRLVGSVRGSNVRLETYFSQVPFEIMIGTKAGSTAMNGEWRSAESSGPSGTWRATRIVTEAGPPPVDDSRVERWTFTKPDWDSESRSRHIRVRWKGDSLYGWVGRDSGFIAGSVNAGRVNLIWLQNDGGAWTLTGTRTSSGQLSGPFPAAGASQGWHAERDVPRRAAQTISWTPGPQISNYSATNPPALRVAPGDTVFVRARDGQSTGAFPPVYVEHALPGDVLVVRILRITPSPTTAASFPFLNLTWFTPEFARTTQDIPGRIAWSLDTATGIATTTQSFPRLGRLSVPLRKHIGQIGVAPAGQVQFGMGEEGAHGGNFDFNELGEGATVYLPVFHEGALLSVGGDVHAAMGDGELTQTGLEMHADLLYTVDVLESRDLDWVRAEDANALIAFGSSGDLNEAMRLAATHLAQWLMNDYALDQRELAALLASSAEIRIANVFGRERTIVAKMPKRVLPTLADRR